ncbi:hypothetical protein ABEB36_011628 [Hypothenemus hampei]|uniref:MYND-type domain-containing protein n=1 Tax=Hypothenemus hampei TaxID=57062 RepID=A0ABD1E8G5_HYPHA
MLETNEDPTIAGEKKVFEAINNNDSVLLKVLLTENPQYVNILDENRMTPLQHAAYKGNKELVRTLLDQGADVKLCEHPHNYTSLHFGALSGNTDVCLLLLEAGAKSTELNTVGRTPSQMAAFVGHHNCVSIINNFIARKDVEHYTRPHGSDNTPPLPPFLLESFHKFIMQINVHPVKVVMNLHNFMGLQEHLKEIKKVLELMCEKEMHNGSDTNEVMSFKFHYLAYVVGEVDKVKQRQGQIDITETFAKKLLKPGKDDSLEFMDAFLKECIREFPYRDSTLFRQIVTTLSREDAPSALFVIDSLINGQKGFLDNVPHCNSCGEEKPAKKCSKCKVVQYCDRNCQRLHWTWHKKVCAKLCQETADADSVRAAKEVDIKELQNLLVNN